MKKYLLFAVCSLLFASAANAEFTTKARSAFLVDFQSGAAIVAENANNMMPPSSMLKLMTLAVAFEEIKAGRLSMDDKITISENADYRNPIFEDASKLCLAAGQQITVHDAVLGLIVQSAGDAGIALSEKIAGSEDAMTKKMTALARKIGMEKSTFGNVSGLPDPNNLMTSRELAMLANYLIVRHADIYPMFATKKFEFNGSQSEWCAKWMQTKTLSYNKLLFIMPEADGLKTGSTLAGGYGMVASAVRNGRRLIAVLNGFNCKDHNVLAAEMKRLLMYGFNETFNKVFYKPGDAIIEIPVWYGRQPTAVATVAKPFVATLDKKQNAKIQIIARFDEPLAAPVRAGEKIGELIAQTDEKVLARAPLVAKDHVGKVQLFARVVKNLQVIFTGK